MNLNKYDKKKIKVAIVQNIKINDHRMVHTNGIANQLANRDYEVDVIIQKSEENNMYENNKYKVIQIPGDTYSLMGQIRFMLSLYIYLFKNKYEIIHSKNPFSSIIPILFFKREYKLIYDIRGLWIDFGCHSGKIPKSLGSILWKIDLYCMMKADKVIVISDELKKHIVEKGIDENKIHVIIGDGVDLNKNINMKKIDLKEKYNINGKIIGYVGSISSSRYSNKIIESFKLLKNNLDKVHLVMVGPVDDVDYFNDLVQENKLTENVIFTGFLGSHDEVIQVQKSFDVAISYHQEDDPIFNVMVPTKILEYLSTGRVIVATNHKSHLSVLENGYNALLSDNNPESFSSLMYDVLVDLSKSIELSKNALKSAEKYTFDSITDQIEVIYNKML